MTRDLNAFQGASFLLGRIRGNGLHKENKEWGVDTSTAGLANGSPIDVTE